VENNSTKKTRGHNRFSHLSVVSDYGAAPAIDRLQV